MTTVRKHSRKRDALLQKLRSTDCHPSAIWIYEQVRKEIPDLSLGTVYRNLSVFKDEGLIVTVGTVKGQERYDGNTREHTHFICMDCGDIIDVELDTDSLLEDGLEEKYKLEIYHKQLTFYGKCSKCRAQSASANNKND